MVVRVRAVREKAVREMVVRVRVVREKAVREMVVRERVVREKAVREMVVRERVVREKKEGTGRKRVQEERGYRKKEGTVNIGYIK